MKTSSPVPRCLTLAAVVLVVSTVVVASPQSEPREPPSAVSAEDEAGRALFARICTPCHDETQITATRRTKAEWEQVIFDMIDRGAMGDGQEFEAVWAYLRRNRGQVYVNQAAQDELTMTLGLSGDDADAIIAYRESNGPFADIEALKQVPDIDVETLEAHKDAVAF